MKTFGSIFLLLICIHISSFHASSTQNSTSTLKHYIVYMGTHSLPNSEAVINSNHEFLASAVGNVDHARRAMVHHYHKSFRGFSAMLTPKQAKQISKRNSVISVFESKIVELHTWRSWKFMDVTPQSIFNHYSVYQNYNVIVGHLDGGVWPESESFSPEGLGPVPKRFRGECITGDQFSLANCNRKIIGARYYYKGFEQDYNRMDIVANGRTFFYSARDDFGHGTHTASTAVGAFVGNISIQDVGPETIRGGAPGARIAVYKVCWFNMCSLSDVLRGFDDAIDDGVDVITMSLGNNEDADYLSDPMSIGAFHAFRNGIFVAASGGNDGALGASTVKNAAPWMLTVAASSIDREFRTGVRMGNSKLLEGYSWNDNPMKGGYYRIIFARFAARFVGSWDDASYCKRDKLDSYRIRGKIVVCTMENPNDEKTEKSEVVRDGGGVGMILIDPYNPKQTQFFVVPTCVIDLEEAQKLKEYLNSDRDPTATILPSQVSLLTKPAPEMAFFSSKGPNPITADLIKPDITAPGLNILAAYTWGPKNLVSMSGTSMSCPHVSGVAAIIKALNPHWSPSEIKSALMTTALHLDNTGQPIKSGSELATPFDLGSGHLNPNIALNPGLVYDFNVEDVIVFLCNHGANSRQMSNLLGQRVSCRSQPIYNLNYPSIGIDNVKGAISVFRTVTYRGKRSDPTTFKVSIEYPEGINLEVEPNILDFSKQNKASFRVNVWVNQPLGRFAFGSITWYNDAYRVRSPIAIRAI